jgi:hypothetical protein
MGYEGPDGYRRGGPGRGCLIGLAIGLVLWGLFSWLVIWMIS